MPTVKLYSKWVGGGESPFTFFYVLFPALLLLCFAACSNDGDNGSGGQIASVTKVELDKPAEELFIGKTGAANTVQLTATVTGTNLADSDKEVTWTSDTETVATVSSAGLVTAVAAGEATVTAKSKKDTTKTAACKITVTKDVVAGNTYKTTSAKRGTSADSMDDGVDANNYCTMVFASNENTWTMTPVGDRMSGMACAGSYSMKGTAVTFTITTGTMAGKTMDATVTSDGLTITWPVTEVGENQFISAVYVKDVVAGKTYKTTSAKMGTTADSMYERADESNYCTLVFAASENTWTLTPTGGNLVDWAGLSPGTYSINGTTIIFTKGEAKMTATVTSDGSTVTWPVINAGEGKYISAVFQKQ